MLAVLLLMKLHENRKSNALLIFGLEDFDHKWTQHTASPKKTVVSIPLSKTAQGMKLWTKSHQLCASTSKMNFLVTCGVSANWITLSPLSLKAAKFLWICLCLACTEILLTKKKRIKLTIVPLNVWSCPSVACCLNGWFSQGLELMSFFFFPNLSPIYVMVRECKKIFFYVLYKSDVKIFGV